MFEFLFAPTLIMTITFGQGSNISETALTFQEDALVCLRAPYEECQTKKCKRVGEGHLAIDVETASATDSYVFPQEITETGTGARRGVQLIGECAQVSAGTPVRFALSQKRKHSAFLKLANRDAP